MTRPDYSRNPTQCDHPVRHHSAGRWITSTRYIVGWRDVGIIKVGCTMRGRARYGEFLCRGAELIDLSHYPNLMDSLVGEVWLQRVLRQTYPAAFADRLEAGDYLKRGAGWTECFLVPVEEWPVITGIANGAQAVAA